MHTPDISVSTNTRFKTLKALLGSRGIKRHGKAFVFGTKLVPETVELFPDIIESCIIDEHHDVPGYIQDNDISTYRLKKDLFRVLDVYGTDYPLLVFATPEIPEMNDSMFGRGLALLVPFQDPANIGAVVRSAAAFGVRDIILLKEAALPYQPKSIRAGGTAVFQVSFSKGPSIIDIKDMPVPIVALSAGGTPLDRFAFPESCAFLPGVEGPGMPPGIEPDHTVSIPMEADVESLNAAVATSIVLYEYKRRLAEQTQL